MRILVDMDGILADLMSKWLGVYNAENNDNVTIQNITTWNVHEHVKIGRDVYKIPAREKFFDDLEPLPGAIEGFKALKRAGHELLVCSSPYNADSARAKQEWCARHLGTSWRDVTLTHKKHWLAPSVDAIIDDKPETIRDFRVANKYVATLPYAYNDCVQVLCHVRRSWPEIVRYFEFFG